MYKRALLRIRERLRSSQYLLTLHARREMNEDELHVFDVEHAILTGEIVERQTDKRTAESKYRIRGRATDESSVEVIVKTGPTGKIVIITSYRI